MTDTIVFDMDGVLFDSERIYARAWQISADAIGLADIDAVISHCVGRNRNDTHTFLREKYGESFPAESFRGGVSEVFQSIVNDEGLPQKEGAAELLAYLEQAGYKIALATSSGRKTTMKNLELSGFARYFQTVVTGDMILHGKPDPEIYLLACRLLGAEPAGAYAVEDSPNGIRSASAAGMKTIMVPDLIEPTAELLALVHAKFDSLLDVKTYLEKQRGGR